MMDMLVLAFQSDSTRISTFMLAHDGSNRSFREIGVSDGHHSISHHQSDEEKLESFAKLHEGVAKRRAYAHDLKRRIDTSPQFKLWMASLDPAYGELIARAV